MTERFSNLVVPLPHKGTDMRIQDTSGSMSARSCAVSLLNTRLGDVDSTIFPATPGTRTSTTATRTTTTLTTSVAPVPSADWSASAGLSFASLVDAYFDCRRTKRNSVSALAFEERLEYNLRKLYDRLVDGSYAPGRSICFVVTRPKPREVWAADFTDRIVHHLLHNQIAPTFYARFISDSCACIPGRGTLYGGKRLESKVRSITQNWSRPAFYLKCDLANFFVSINKNILATLLAKRITDPWWWRLTETVLFHDPRQNYEYRGNPHKINLVPSHKQLAQHPAHLGLPIGNLSSQFFANVYMDVLDQFIKHEIRCKHYIRYVDDFVLLHESPQFLNDAKGRIEILLAEKLEARLNPTKTILQPIDRGIDFVGYVIKPWRRQVRRRSVRTAIHRIETVPADKSLETINSYLGLMRHTNGYRDRAKVSAAARKRGHSIAWDATKAYRKPATPHNPA
ncbi:RNA-directed DNA polymerase [Alcaligenes aquatilis]|uniref:RNA-directed DNA polymerase n=1 Tax=Alcaligenes aquatilis TaxID=323284 RepID=A0A3G2I153_9BURK|nr:RNA-directed DNA polymerase [Alcaligenes aquatilis]